MVHHGESLAHSASIDMKESSSFWASQPGYKPVLLLIALVIFCTLIILPPPQGLLDLVSTENPPGY